MKGFFNTIGLTAMLAGCFGQNQATEQTLGAPKRDLGPCEKMAPAIFLAGLKVPKVQFKCTPVFLTERDGITYEFRLVNGGDAGFVRFYAHLRKDHKAQFTRAFLHDVGPLDREINLDSRWLNVCEKFYDGFSLPRRA